MNEMNFGVMFSQARFLLNVGNSQTRPQTEKKGRHIQNITRARKHISQQIRQYYSPAQNQFDLELWYKVFFFIDSCRLDIAINDSG